MGSRWYGYLVVRLRESLVATSCSCFRKPNSDQTPESACSGWCGRLPTCLRTSLKGHSFSVYANSTLVENSANSSPCLTASILVSRMSRSGSYAGPHLVFSFRPRHPHRFRTQPGQPRTYCSSYQRHLLSTQLPLSIDLSNMSPESELLAIRPSTPSDTVVWAFPSPMVRLARTGSA